MIVVLSYTGCCPHNDSTLIQMLATGINALASPQFPKQAKEQGKDRHCWNTVREAVKHGGGQMVSGWSIVDKEPLIPQTNPLARTVLNAHCVWQRGGILFEMIPERHGLPFIQSDLPTPSACVEFFDDQKSFRALELPRWNLELLPCTYRFFQLDLSWRAGDKSFPRIEVLSV